MRTIKDHYYLYIIGAEFLDRKMVKIGISNNPEKRVKSLQIGSPIILTLHHKINVVDKKLALLMESVFHQENLCKGITGEWFLMSEKEAFDFIYKRFRAVLFFLGAIE